MRNTYASNAALAAGNTPKACDYQAARVSAVYQKTVGSEAGNAGNAAKTASPLDKPYVEAQVAAELLGTNRETVIADIQRGIDGKDFMALSGGRVGWFWLVERWELVGDRLAIHRGRFATGAKP